MAPRGPIPRLEVVDEIPSTQSALVQAVREAPDEWPDMSVIAASHQTQGRGRAGREWVTPRGRSEEHTSELQSRGHLVCRLLLEKKNILNFTGKWVLTQGITY